MQTIPDDMVMRLADLLVLRPSPFPWRIVTDGTLAGPCVRVGRQGGVLPALGLVGLGMLLVTGLAVAASPSLRQQLRARLRRAPQEQAQPAR